MGRNPCDKEKCCFCCSISVGIKFLGVWLVAECLLNVLALLFRNPPSPVTDGISVGLSLLLAIFFFWSFFSEKSLPARNFWLVAMIADFVIHILMTLFMLYNVNFTEFVRDDHCQNYPLKMGYGVTVDGDYV